MSGPIFGLCSERLSILSRIIGFIRSQTQRNTSTSMIAEANLDDTQSIFVRSRERSTTYRVKHSSDIAFFPRGADPMDRVIEQLTITGESICLQCFAILHQ